MSGARLLTGDALAVLRTLPDGLARCCVTSPPYFGLRDYGMDGQLGLEPTPDAYVARMVEVFREVRRVLSDDGTLWLNVGDSYAAMRSYQVPSTKGGAKHSPAQGKLGASVVPDGLKGKDLVGIPWRLAFALQSDGWYLRSDVIWAKNNPMPESVTDRPTKAHEYVFLLSKQARYYYDAAAIAEPVTESTTARLAQDVDHQRGSDRVPGKTNGRMKAVPPRFGGSKYGDADTPESRTKSGKPYIATATRNARTVWTIATRGYAGAHFATMPPELAQRCVLAGSAPGDTVLDPFGGSGTTAMVAVGAGRDAIHIDLNPAYYALAVDRIGPMLCEVVA